MSRQLAGTEAPFRHIKFTWTWCLQALILQSLMSKNSRLVVCALGSFLSGLQGPCLKNDSTYRKAGQMNPRALEHLPG